MSAPCASGRSPSPTPARSRRSCSTAATCRRPRMGPGGWRSRAACGRSSSSGSSAVWFSWDNLALTVAQCACLALPAAGLPLWTRRFRTGAWALVLPLNIVVVVVLIAVLPTTADVLSWVALLLVPPGCALALGWAAHGARLWLAVLAAPLLAAAWGLPDSRLGQLAAIVLIIGASVTLGRLLAGVVPLPALRVAVVAM